MVIEFIEPPVSANAFVWCAYYLMQMLPALLVLQAGLFLAMATKVYRCYRSMASNLGEGLILLEEMRLNKTASDYSAKNRPLIPSGRKNG